MKPYTLELDDELIEQINQLDNATELLTKAIKGLLSSNNSEESHEAWIEAQVSLAEKEANTPDAQWFSIEDTFQEAYQRINNAHSIL